MKFGPVPLEEAIGAISAHAIRAGEVFVRKGAVISGEVAARLRQAGVESVVAARLGFDDFGEDEAALRLAEALAGGNVAVERPFTGRSNLYATRAGLLVVDASIVNSLNAVDEAITAATLPAYKPVVEGEMIGTVKIIPLAVAGTALDRALAIAGREGALRVAPFTRRDVAVVSTVLPGLKPSVIVKTLDALQSRLAPAGARITAERRVPHEAEALRRELADPTVGQAELIVIFGASAIADRRDVIPAAIERAGGRIERFGMPVDPGNLLLLGALGGRPVIGAPGCARSPKENGFDWVLQRLLASLPVTRADIAALGVGGLLMEIVSRPQPRVGGKRIDHKAAQQNGIRDKP